MKKEFKKILLDEGITNQTIYSSLGPFKYPLNTKFQEELDINLVYKIYKNKISFIYDDYKKYKDPERTKYLIKKLNLNIKSRIGVIDWRVDYKVIAPFYRFNLQEKREILLDAVKGFKHVLNLKCKIHESINPNPNDILINEPSDIAPFFPVRSNNLLLKRSRLNSRFGFSNLDQYNYQFAIYDENLNLNPI